MRCGKGKGEGVGKKGATERGRGRRRRETAAEEANDEVQAGYSKGYSGQTPQIPAKPYMIKRLDVRTHVLASSDRVGKTHARKTITCIPSHSHFALCLEIEIMREVGKDTGTPSLRRRSESARRPAQEVRRMSNNTDEMAGWLGGCVGLSG